jgi:hypothetical protein
MDQVSIKYMYQHLPLQDPPKFTQIWIFGLKTNHLATLDLTACRELFVVFFGQSALGNRKAQIRSQNQNQFRLLHIRLRERHEALPKSMQTMCIYSSFSWHTNQYSERGLVYYVYMYVLIYMYVCV